MRCIYIVPNSPISPNYSGGGSAIYYEQLLSLKELGVDVYLWHFTYEQNLEKFDAFVSKDKETWNLVQENCEKVYRSIIPDRPSYIDRVSNKLSNAITGNEILHPPLRKKCYPILKTLLNDVKPDFIWAQHLAAAQIASLQSHTPVVFSHHDWLHKIKFINSEDLSKYKLKKIEEYTARRASAMVSGSVIECDQLRNIGCQNVHYIPLAYEPVNTQTENNGGPRIIHLGGLGTTANRIGLERFFEVVFDSLNLKKHQMWVVGDMSRASRELENHLRLVTTTGYINDLNKVMRSDDIHVIPWEQETGQRTRLVCAFNYGQAVVAMRQAVACFPEVIGDYNALLVDKLEEMPDAIKLLLQNNDLRRRLGSNARLTFENHFTRKVLLPRYKKVIDSITFDGLVYIK